MSGPKPKPFEQKVLDRLILDESGCWLWPGAKTNGYGTVTSSGQTYRLHRLVWQELVGPIPRGVEIDHLCRVRHCVNPDHLELVDHATNMGRAVMPWRGGPRVTHCKRGHEYTEANTYLQDGHRSCRVCRNSYHTRRRAA